MKVETSGLENGTSLKMLPTLKRYRETLQVRYIKVYNKQSYLNKVFCFLSFFFFFLFLKMLVQAPVNCSLGFPRIVISLVSLL